MRFKIDPGYVVSRCRSCGADVVWTVTATGKHMPLSLKTKEAIIEDGKVVAYTMETHFADCPNADRHRKPKERT